MLVFLLCLALSSLVGWIGYRHLFAVPVVDQQADRAFLANKVVWITGASSGIGEALAQYLRGNSSVQVVLSARNVSALESVKASLLASGVREVFVLPLDLVALANDAAAARDKVHEVLAKFGRIDVLIHNGGMSMRGDFASTKLEVDHQLMNCNTFGAIALTKAALPGMLRRGAGHITVMSSVQGKLPIAFRSSYAAAKHALHGFFHSLRYEVADLGIKVTILCPGYVRTNMSLNALNADGTAYGKMDETQARGYDPLYIAGVTYSSTRLALGEVVVADLVARIGILLYALCPELLTRIMLKRTKKERAKLAQD